MLILYKSQFAMLVLILTFSTVECERAFFNCVGEHNVNVQGRNYLEA